MFQICRNSTEGRINFFLDNPSVYGILIIS